MESKMKVHTDQIIMVEHVKLYKCTEMDLDIHPEYIDYLVTGECIEVSNTSFYISEAILFGIEELPE